MAFIPLENRLRKEGYSFVAGVDEAGRGPLAGPLVVAAVILKPHAKLPGVNDSKKLSPQKREQLFPLILKNCLDYSITCISHITIDEINILRSVQLGNLLCVQHLKHTPDITLLDGRDKQILTTPFQTIIRGDGKIKSIAAASILAKVFRDRLMVHYAKEFKNYGFAKHKGYGTCEHRSNIVKFGPCELHRKSYSLTP